MQHEYVCAKNNWENLNSLQMQAIHDQSSIDRSFASFVTKEYL